MSTIDELRERIDIVDLISTRTSLRKAGRSFKGLCPFHPEKTPSFVVYPENWSYHCFGCGAHGSGIDFVMQTQNVEFKDALAELAGRAGISLAAVRREADPEVEHARQRLRAALDAAARYFYNLLINSPQGAAARAYTEKRGIERRTIDAFLLGYSPAGWTDLTKYLTDEGFTEQELLDAGLQVERDEGRRYDRFRNRLMFPIRDSDGRTVGFGARALDDSTPKYLNSPQTALFDKSAVLYGIDRAKDAIRQAGQVVVVEGYMDVIALHQRGIQNVVAAMGTSLTDRQIRGLKRFSANITLALDADAAGAEATLRGLDVARQALDQKVVPVPTWHGTVRYEQALNATIRVAVMPSGQDPDDVAKAGGDAWQRLVDGALPVLDYLLDVVAAGVPRDDPKAKSAAAERILPVIAEIRDPIQAGHYRQRLADRLGLSESDLLAALRQLNRKAAPAESVPATQRAGPLTPEEYCLALLLQTPELAATAAELDLEPADFGDAAARELFAQWLAGGGALDPAAWDPDLEALYGKLIGYGLPADGVASLQTGLREAIVRVRKARMEYQTRTSTAEFTSLPPESERESWEAAVMKRLAELPQAKNLRRPTRRT